MKRIGKIAAACLIILGAGTITASADDCSGHPHDTATALGAGGGALVGGLGFPQASSGAVVGGVAGGFAGNAIARSNDCRHRYSYRDSYGHRHYYYR